MRYDFTSGAHTVFFDFTSNIPIDCGFEIAFHWYPSE